MGRAPCCEKVGLKRGRWTAEEDEILKNYILSNGEAGSWRSLPKNAGLLRCGKSCRLRWINYLRSDLKRGNFSSDEEQIIINLHASMGNRWSLIAGLLPGRTDNEIKNYWNSHLSRKIDSFRPSNHHFVPPPTAKIEKRIAIVKKKQNHKKGTSTATKPKPPSEQTEESTDASVVANAAVPMPTTPTPEKETLSSTILIREELKKGLNSGNNSNPKSSMPISEDVSIMESSAAERCSTLSIDHDDQGIGSGAICEDMGVEYDGDMLRLDDILSDVNGILSIMDEDKDDDKKMETDNMECSMSDNDKSGIGNSINPGSSDNGEWRVVCTSPGNYSTGVGWDWNWDWDWDYDGGTVGFGYEQWGQEENTLSWLSDSGN